MKRHIEFWIEEHFKECRQMLFVSGPRQVGKTTAALQIVIHTDVVDHLVTTILLSKKFERSDLYKRYALLQ